MPDSRKRGFRLPWMRADGGHDGAATQLLEAEPASTDAAGDDEGVEGDGAGDRSFGSGPFGIAPPPRERPNTEALRQAADDARAEADSRGGHDSRLEDGASPKWLLRPGLEIAGDSPVDAASPPPSEGTAGASTRAVAVRENDAAGTAAAARTERAAVVGGQQHPEGGPGLGAAWPEADLGARVARVAEAAARAAAEASPEPVTFEGPPETSRLEATSPEASDSQPGEDPPGEEALAAREAVPPDDEIEDDGLAFGLQRVASAVGPGHVAGSRKAGARAAAAAVSTPAAHEGRRDNPLLTGLVRAMRESAKSTREETSTRLRAEAAARIAAIRSRSGADAVALRKQADEDVAAIREWSKAEMARIRAETAERIEARHGQLATDSRALTSVTGRLVGEIEAAVSRFEAEMKRFFKALLSEEDPSQLATLAERMPEPPVLEALPEAVAVGIAHVSSGAHGHRRTPARAGTAAKARTRSSGLRPAAGTRAGGSARRPARPRELTAREPRPAADPAPIGDPAPIADPAPVAPRPLDATAAALAEAEALAGLDLPTVGGSDWPLAGFGRPSNGTPAQTGEPADGDALELFLVEGQTRLIVVGLGDDGVGAFEDALRGVSGVGSVNVSPGGDGEVVFSVTHGTATDLRAAVPELPGFHATVTADEGAILSVEARRAA